MTSENKEISIIVTAYNRKEYLNYAINSLPSDDNIDIVLVTNLEEKIISNDFKKISYFYNEGRTYGSMLREGINESKGNIIFFLEDDDEFSPLKVKYVKKVFKTVKNLSYYHNSYIKIDERGNDLPSQAKTNKYLFGPFSNIKELKRTMNRDVDHNLSSIVINKQYIDTKELAALNMINLSVDTYMFAMSVKDGARLFDDNVFLTKYRIHNSTSHPNIDNKLYNPYIRLHKLYSNDYILSSNISQNPYLRDFLKCRSEVEKLYYSFYLGEDRLRNILNSIQCIKYIDFTTIKNRIEMFINEFKK